MGPPPSSAFKQPCFYGVGKLSFGRRLVYDLKTSLQICEGGCVLASQTSFGPPPPSSRSRRKFLPQPVPAMADPQTVARRDRCARMVAKVSQNDSSIALATVPRTSNVETL